LCGARQTRPVRRKDGYKTYWGALNHAMVTSTNGPAAFGLKVDKVGEKGVKRVDRKEGGGRQ